MNLVLEYLREHWVFALISLGPPVLLWFLTQYGPLFNLLLRKPKIAVVFACIPGLLVWGILNLTFSHFASTPPGVLLGVIVVVIDVMILRCFWFLSTANH